LTEWRKPATRDAVRTAVRFPLRLVLHMQTEDGMIEATTRDVSSNGLLFATQTLPRIGSTIEFAMEMPAEVMGWEHNGSIHCLGRVIRHHQVDEERMAAAVIDEYSLKADA
jgi:hypothetical protein